MLRGRNSNHIRLLAFTVTLLAFSAIVFGQEKESQFPGIKIKNFGQMDERFYRGAQPREDDYKALASLGIKTIIDLRDEPKDFEKPAVEAAGMRYVNIPMEDKAYPREEQIQAFLKLVDDPNTGKFFVHCAGGRHRTGVMGAVYRFTQNKWTYDRVYAEMKQYDFYSRWGHGPLKKYVQDYWANHQANKPAVTSVPQID